MLSKSDAFHAFWPVWTPKHLMSMSKISTSLANLPNLKIKSLGNSNQSWLGAKRAHIWTNALEHIWWDTSVSGKLFYKQKRWLPSLKLTVRPWKSPSQIPSKMVDFPAKYVSLPKGYPSRKRFVHSPPSTGPKICSEEGIFLENSDQKHTGNKQKSYFSWFLSTL